MLKSTANNTIYLRWIHTSQRFQSSTEKECGSALLSGNFSIVTVYAIQVHLTNIVANFKALNQHKTSQKPSVVKGERG